MPKNKQTLLLDCIGYLYDAATDVDKWKAFLESLTHLFDADFATFNHGDVIYKKLSFMMDYGFEHLGERRKSRLLSRYKELAFEDLLLPSFVNFPEKPLSCRQIIDQAPFDVAQYHETRVYQEARKPFGIEYLLAVLLPFDDGGSSVIGIARRPERNPFDQDNCDLLGQLVPHIKRALSLSRQLAILDFGQRSAAAALDQLPTGIILTDAEGQIQLINKAARQITDRNDGLTQYNRRVAANDPKQTAAILGYIRQAVENAHDENILPGEAISITRPSGARPLPVVIGSLWGNLLKFELGRLDEPLAILFVTDPDTPLETAPELLQRLFGLTPAEAVLAERLVAGDTLKSAAKTLGITVNTTRDRLKTVFGKTNTHSQAALIKMIMSTPVGVRIQDGDGALPPPL